MSDGYSMGPCFNYEILCIMVFASTSIRYDKINTLIQIPTTKYPYKSRVSLLVESMYVYRYLIKPKNTYTSMVSPKMVAIKCMKYPHLHVFVSLNPKWRLNTYSCHVYFSVWYNMSLYTVFVESIRLQFHKISVVQKSICI
jgi:hypothetical protein